MFVPIRHDTTSIHVAYRRAESLRAPYTHLNAEAVVERFSQERNTHGNVPLFQISRANQYRSEGQCRNADTLQD